MRTRKDGTCTHSESAVVHDEEQNTQTGSGPVQNERQAQFRTSAEAQNCLSDIIRQRMQVLYHNTAPTNLLHRHQSNRANSAQSASRSRCTLGLHSCVASHQTQDHAVSTRRRRLHVRCTHLDALASRLVAVVTDTFCVWRALFACLKQHQQ
jgi:hypothetical protein